MAIQDGYAEVEKMLRRSRKELLRMKSIKESELATALEAKRISVVIELSEQIEELQDEFNRLETTNQLIEKLHNQLQKLLDSKNYMESKTIAIQLELQTRDLDELEKGEEVTVAVAPEPVVKSVAVNRDASADVDAMTTHNVRESPQSLSPLIM